MCVALSALADTLIMVYPNAGLPNDLGAYDEEPETTAGFIREWVDTGLINVIGGCCGTTPEHIPRWRGRCAGISRACRPSRRRGRCWPGWSR